MMILFKSRNVRTQQQQQQQQQQRENKEKPKKNREQRSVITKCVSNDRTSHERKQKQNPKRT